MKYLRIIWLCLVQEKRWLVRALAQAQLLARVQQAT
jgi:hypothetical protein